MPALTGSPLFTSLDVQEALLAALNADNFVQSVFQNAATEPQFNPLLDDDPTSVSQDQNAIAAISLSGEGEADATVGALLGGTADVIVSFTAVLYFYEGSNRSAAVKRSLVTAASVLRQAIMRNRQLSGVPAGGSAAAQLTWACYWRPLMGRLSTIYYPGDGFRVARIGFDMISRIAYN